MIIFLLIFNSFGQDSISFLDTGSELTIEGHAGLKLINGAENCRIGVFNSSYPFGIACKDDYPLYIDDSRRVHFGADVLTEADMKFAQRLVISGVNQWNLIHFDTFDTTVGAGWSNSTVTACGGVRMLGGYCQFSQGTTWKEFKGLSDHSQVRIKAVWYFIDEWRGETGYIEVGTSTKASLVWSQTYDVTLIKNPIDLCGSTGTGEGKFGVAVDLQLLHSSSSLVIVFGSTLENSPCEKSWGISGLEIYIR